MNPKFNIEAVSAITATPILAIRTIDLSKCFFRELRLFIRISQSIVSSIALAKEGTAKANEYLNSIKGTLQARQGQGIYEDIEDNLALEYVFGAVAGLDQFASGTSRFLQIFSLRSMENTAFLPTILTTSSTKK